MHQFLRGTRRIQTGPSLNGFLPPPARGTSEGPWVYHVGKRLTVI
jgi:hypothetical protein